MKHVIFEQNTEYKIAFLIKESALFKNQLESTYINSIKQQGINPKDCIGFSLDYDSSNKKAPVKMIKSYLGKLLPSLLSLGTKYLVVCDTNYFKVLTKQKKAEPHYGYVLPCAMQGFEDLSVILMPNYQALHFNPDIQSKIDFSLKTLVNALNGVSNIIGSDIIKYSYYPEKLSAIEAFLNSLHRYEVLTCDIEAFDLKHYNAGIGSITFCWDKHSGGAFLCDYVPLQSQSAEGLYGYRKVNQEVRELLLNFFLTYKGKLIYHNASYDIRTLIYNLFMDHLIDQKGLLKGLHCMTANIDDTKIISYLATNSCTGNQLSLKDQAHEFAGNYAQDEIKNILAIEHKQLLKYNLIDGLATWYVYEKNHPKMVQDNQLEVYNEIFKPSIKTIIQMELTGMCLDMDKVLYAEKLLLDKRDKIIDQLNSFHTTVQMLGILKEETWENDYQTRVNKAKNPEKIKRKNIDDMPDIFINPNSNPQMQRLLYDFMGLPVIDTTDGGAPAVGADTLEKLLNHTDNDRYKEVIQGLYDFSKLDKILSAFIPAFKAAPKANDGMHYLFGNFNLNVTMLHRAS